MGLFSQEFVSKTARLRFDVNSSKPRESLLEDMTFLNYRLAAVELADKVTLPKADIVWNEDKAVKDIRYADGVLTLDGEWFEGEIQKIIVTMLAFRLEAQGLHPFHSSAVRYKGKTIVFLGGESNHGKTMSQLEGCNRGALNISTETIVIDDSGTVVMGSTSVFLRKRAKGTERSDLADQDEGVTKLFGKAPEVNHYLEPSKVDLVVVPAIDGNFATSVSQMGQFEKEYQSYHSMMNFFGLNQLLSSPGLVMPIVDTDELRRKRAEFLYRFTEPLPYYMVRAKNPQLLFDEVEKLL
jgi:hypothetical protein